VFGFLQEWVKIRGKEWWGSKVGGRLERGRDGGEDGEWRGGRGEERRRGVGKGEVNEKGGGERREGRR